MDWFVSYNLRFCSFGYVYTVFSDPVNSHRSWICHNMNSNGTELEHYESFTHRTLCYRPFSFTWPAPMQIYWNKRKRLHKKRVQLPQDWFGTPTWLPFHCFGTPTWPPWRHVKTLYCSRKGFGALSSSPHSWMFTSVSVGSNPRPYLFATATVPNGCLHCTKVHHESYPTSFSLISLMLSSQNMHTELWHVAIGNYLVIMFNHFRVK